MTVTAGILNPDLDKSDALVELLESQLNASAAALTVVSGTAQQDQTGFPSNVYVAVTGGTAGTVAIAIGQTSACAASTGVQGATIVPTSDATLSRSLQTKLPAGWFFKVTVGGAAAIASAVQVVG
jgi:hypothetical protein